MLKLKNYATCPPDFYTFRFPDGHVVTAVDATTWFEKIAKHYADNNYERPENWEALAEHALCRRLSGEWCDGGSEHSFINTRFGFNDFLRGTKVLGSFLLAGAEVVSQEQAEARALVCSRCVANVSVSGCGTCNGVANAVAEAKGAQKTKYDHLLKACGVCHCANEAAVWIPAEYLAKGVTPEMMQTYREIDADNGCWKYQELTQNAIATTNASDRAR